MLSGKSLFFMNLGAREETAPFRARLRFGRSRLIGNPFGPPRW